MKVMIFIVTMLFIVLVSSPLAEVIELGETSMFWEAYPSTIQWQESCIIIAGWNNLKYQFIQISMSNNWGVLEALDTIHPSIIMPPIGDNIWRAFFIITPCDAFNIKVFFTPIKTGQMPINIFSWNGGKEIRIPVHPHPFLAPSAIPITPDGKLITTWATVKE